VSILDRTLPAAEYTSAGAYERERDTIFGRAWQLAAFSADLDEPGRFVTATLGDREFVVARAEDGRLNAFHNVCLHRGAAVASGAGSRRTLQCPYHGWTYRLDGSLYRAPGFAEPPAGVRLLQVSVCERPPLVFVSPASDPPDFDEQFGSLFQYLDRQGVDLTAIAAGSARQVRQFEMAANWKVVVENSLECYHCKVAHPGLADTLDLDLYEHRIERWWSVQGAPMRATPQRAETALGTAARTAAAESGGFDFSRFVFLYPNLFLEVYPGTASFATLVVLPLEMGKTRSVHTKFVLEPMSDDEEHEWSAFVDQVIKEDVVLCESVQRGLRSGVIERGILNLDGGGANEACIGHFDALVAEAGLPP
jgi:choline monooxygenase